MSSDAKWTGLLPELESDDNRVLLADQMRSDDENRVERVFNKASRAVRATIDAIKAAARLIERFLTTFAVLEILGVVLLMIFLQL